MTTAGAPLAPEQGADRSRPHSPERAATVYRARRITFAEHARSPQVTGVVDRDALAHIVADLAWLATIPETPVPYLNRVKEPRVSRRRLAATSLRSALAIAGRPGPVTAWQAGFAREAIAHARRMLCSLDAHGCPVSAPSNDRHAMPARLLALIRRDEALARLLAHLDRAGPRDRHPETDPAHPRARASRLCAAPGAPNAAAHACRRESTPPRAAQD